MAPKKKPNQGTSTRTKAKFKTSLKSIPSLLHEEPSPPNHGESSSQITSIMNRKNRLGDLLNDRLKQRQLTPLRSNKRQLRLFEEDEGFKFKRSQETNNIAQVSTPISRLREELIGISDDELAPISYGNGYERRTNRKRYEEEEEDNNNNNNGDTRVGNVLSSPIRSNAKRAKSSARNIKSKKPAPVTYVDEYSLDEIGQATATKSRLKRRTSYHNRGKRLLSIGNGFVGVPHDTIGPAEYYKLLDNSLPEPHRMRQLLIWCFKKKLDQEDKQKYVGKSEEDKTLMNIAKVIKEEILTDLVNGEIETSWYNKDKNKLKESLTSVNKKNIESTHSNRLLPNPLNIQTLKNIELYHEKLKELQKERQDWDKSVNKYCKDITLDKFASIERDTDIKGIGGNADESVRTVFKENLLQNIEDSIQEVEDIPNHIENSIDKVSSTAYRLYKGHELIDSIQRNVLNGQISAVAKDCMLGKTIAETKDEKKEELQDFWLISRPPTTKELLRGISRLDAR